MTAPRIAVTRAEPEASRTAARIDSMGGTAVLAPLLTIENKPAFDRSLEGVQALLFTSANGVRAFGASDPALPVLTVGLATANAARDLGYRRVTTADGDSRALTALALSLYRPEKGLLVHVSGAHVAGDVAAALVSAGFKAERRVAYEAHPVDALPSALLRRLGNDPPDLDRVMFHSARAGEVFLRFARVAAPRLTAVCISEAVADAVRDAAWSRIIVAERAREDALLSAALAQ